MLMTLYKVDHKSRKWYRQIFYWSFNVAIVNGWLLYNNVSRWELQFPSRLIYSSLRLVSQSLPMEKATLKLIHCQMISSQSFSADPQDEETGDVPMKKSRRTFLVNVSAICQCIVNQNSAANCMRGCYVGLKCLECDCYLCVTKNRNCCVTFHTNE